MSPENLAEGLHPCTGESLRCTEQDAHTAGPTLGQMSHTAPLEGPWEATESMSTFFSLAWNRKARTQHQAQAVRTLAWMDLVKSESFLLPTHHRGPP